ncbi:PhzF family phenazine biosynthesis protein [Erwinia piriflorinigrans]|uniref:Diaminopimelate epimerase n=1 Tax=Erwinia piriflorinigrans CFBP 5888 TaxID=1161919 RepID=V5Z3C3_9GAMM|nr:PhzF family phenazine biosynthesis protein [Erwinia piriflorinigrans]CCG85484.1 Diaminopimelate epimerase [Erwinia piriflorinigrans CFBP 5888]
MTQLRPFKQVDVFTSTPCNGNPLAVIMDANGLSDAQMQAIASWTNLSETTFVLPPTDEAADYRVRIFTKDMELPFAGHPTLGTAHALLEAGHPIKLPGQIVQECPLGLVKIKIGANGALAFAAPEAILTPFSDAPISSALNNAPMEEQLPVMIADMGIRWLLVPMASAEAVLATKPDAVEFARLLQKTRVNGVMIFAPLQGANEQYEVRALIIEQGALNEDPVTGSANACLARYFQARGVELDYQVRQGTALQRAGRLSVGYAADGIWIGGQTITVINGTIQA